jgi:hypothetical protein
MAVFNISFRIKQAGDHASRYESVVNTIRAEAKDKKWEETTSFFVLESDKTTEGLADAIYYQSEFMSDWDKLIVVNLSFKSYATKGAIEYPATLSSLMSAR